jgi:hypothetical protein
MTAAGFYTPQANVLAIDFNLSPGGEELHELIEIERAAMTIAEDRIGSKGLGGGTPQILYAGRAIEFHEQVQNFMAVNSLR